MHKDNVIEIEHIYKKFCRSLKRSMLYGFWDITRSMLGIGYPTDYLRKKEFWALEDISFNLKKGEVLGVVGVNGSGKSTLLRLITGIYPPDSGIIKIRGRVSAMIAVGAGFHPNMSGLENIYLNGTILGMRKKEINKKLQDIIDFADIGDFLDAPVSTYSSGMRVRLGFAIAIHATPEILLIDEILAVGDQSFKNKCLRKIAQLKEKKVSIIFISHNIEHVRLISDRVILLDKGKILYQGSTQKGLAMYEDITREIRALSLENEFKKTQIRTKNNINFNKNIKFKKIGILNKSGKDSSVLAINEEINLYFDFKLTENFKELYFAFAVADERNNICIWILSNYNNSDRFINLSEGNYRIKANIKNHNLAPGVYYLNYAIKNGQTYEMYDQGYANFVFQVSSDKKLEKGIVNVNETWNLKKRK